MSYAADYGRFAPFSLTAMQVFAFAGVFALEVLWALRFTGRVRRAKSRGLRSMTAANGSLHVPLEASGDGAGGTLKGTPAGSTPSSPTALQGEAGIVMWSGINPLHGSRSDGPGGRGDPGSERQANAPPQSLPPPPPPPSHVPKDELDGTQWSAHNPLHRGPIGSVPEILPPSLGRTAPAPVDMAKRLSFLMIRGSGSRGSEGRGHEVAKERGSQGTNQHGRSKAEDDVAAVSPVPGSEC
jgi:hypothetical protein